MQVNLRENEIAKAVEMYLKHHGLKTRGTDVTVQFSMGKGANGLRAEVNVEGLDKPCDIPGFGPHDREIDIPLQLLDTVFTEDEVKPGTLGALIQRHTEDVQVELGRTVEPEQREGLVTEAQYGLTEAEAAARGDIPQELVPEPEGDTGAPWQTEEPVMEVLAVVEAGEPSITDPADDVGIDIGEAVATAHVDVEEAEAAEVIAEAVAIAEVAAVEEAAPVEAKPVRRPIFGKKPAAEPEPVAVEEAESLIPEEVSPAVVAELAKATTGPVRRSTSLFKKPAA